MPLVETIDLCQKYGERDVLKNINLTIDKGEMFALIGPSGAGKTTLLRLINLLDSPHSGKIYFDGIDTFGLGRRKLETQRRMSFVLQKPVVFNTTVYNNISYGLKWRGAGKSEIEHKVGSTLEMVGISAYKSRNARTLSGGEMQRVAIARAITLEPELLLLDEPTANLDPVSIQNIEELIDAIRHQYNTTIVMATHDLSQGQRLADRVGVLLNGEICQTGDWSAVFNSPNNRAIAHFVGVENIIDGIIAPANGNISTIDAGGKIIEVISNYPEGKRVAVCLRPEDITLALSRHSSSARNSFLGEIIRVVSTGPISRIELDCGFPLVALVTRKSVDELELCKGKPVYATFKATAVHVIDRDSNCGDSDN